MTFKRELIYQDRLVAFVDILGFKDAVNKSAGADEWCIKLRKKINRLVDNNESFQLYNDAFKVLYEEQLKGKAEETAEPAKEEPVAETPVQQETVEAPAKPKRQINNDIDIDALVDNIVADFDFGDDEEEE